MREIHLNGYIDDEQWFGDEITPGALHESLYGQANEQADDVHIRLNSYGGSCNAATRMHDDIRAYPGKVHITISGTAASAATVMAQAADVLDITPGSLFMIHDPATAAYGNEKDMDDAKAVLRACKESILNVYQTRSKKSRNKLSDMMSATTWMDARQALEYGLVDAIVENTVEGVQNAAGERAANRAEAEKGVQAWFDRQKDRNAAPCPAAEAEDLVIATSPCLTNALHISAAEAFAHSIQDSTATAARRVQVLATDTRLEHLRY